MSLARRLQILRSREGVSLQELADNIGASKTHVWDLETGRSDNPSIDLLTKLATFFNVPVATLIGENPEADGEDQKLVTIYRDLKGLSDRDIAVIRGLVDQMRATTQHMSDREVAATKRRDRNARASLAIEGSHATPEQDAMFQAFNDQRLPHDARRKVLADRASRRAAKRSAAE